jgi:CarD family transcriptional regulator
MSVCSFVSGDLVVYPAHGVGRVLSVESHDMGGSDIPMLVIHFDKDRLTARVPVARAHKVGLRSLSSLETIEKVMKVLGVRRRVARSMWSRRAQEYESKINSGDPVSLAEVVRELYRQSGGLDQAYSERQIYQSAFDRLCREVAAVQKIDEGIAAARLQDALAA